MLEQYLTQLIIAMLVVWNIAVFVVYLSDKRRSIRRKWRVPESTLLIMAFAGGSVGAFCGMYLIRHKTKHLKFKLLIPLALLIQIGIAVYVLYSLM